MISDQGEHAILVEYDPKTNTPTIVSYTQDPIASGSHNVHYLSQCSFGYIEQDNATDIQNERFHMHTQTPFASSYSQSQSRSSSNQSPSSSQSPTQSYFVSLDQVCDADPIPVSDIPSHSGFAFEVLDTHPEREIYVSAKKKYKPVHLKVNPVKATLPSEFRIERNIVGDPLEGMPSLPTNPPKFEPTGRYTAERQEAFRKRHDTGFLYPSELNLVDNLVANQEQAFAWNDTERGTFRHDFFPPVKMPVLPHTPWVERNIPIPPGIYDEVCGIIRKKIASGVYEPSNSSYRSRWFCVLKKDGKSLRIVHSLEPLNRVTIQHGGVPPIPRASRGAIRW